MYNQHLAEKQASELLSLMTVINNRLEQMISYEFKLLSADKDLWFTVSSQLRDAAATAHALFRNCGDMQP